MNLLKLTFILFSACLPGLAANAQSNDFVRIIGLDTIGVGGFGLFDGPVVKSPTNYYITIISEKDMLNKNTLIKTDLDLNPLWAKKFITPAGPITHVALMHSNGYLYFATNPMVPNPNGVPTLAMFKVDTAGTMQFARTYWKQQTSNPSIHTNGLAETHDGNLFLSAELGLTPNGVYMKINPVDGTIIWSVEIPGVRSHGNILMDSLGNFYMNCHTSSNPYIPMLLKISSGGIPVFCKRFENAALDLTSTSIRYTTNNTIKMFGNASTSVSPYSVDQYIINLDTAGNLLSQKMFSCNFPDTILISRDILKEDSTGFIYSGIYQIGAGYNSYGIWHTDQNDSVTSATFYRDSLYSSTQYHEYFKNPDGSLDLFSYAPKYSYNTQQCILGNLVRRFPPSFNSVCGGTTGTVFTQAMQPPIQQINVTMNPQYSQYVSDTAGLSGYFLINAIAHADVSCTGPLATQELPVYPKQFYYNSGNLHFFQENADTRLLEIYDPVGRRVQNTLNPFHYGPLSVEKLHTGIYIAVLTAGDGSRSVLKFFKE